MRERSDERLLHRYKLYDSSATKVSVRPKTNDSLRAFRKERKRLRNQKELKRLQTTFLHLNCVNAVQCSSLQTKNNPE